MAINHSVGKHAHYPLKWLHIGGKLVCVGRVTELILWVVSLKKWLQFLCRGQYLFHQPRLQSCSRQRYLRADSFNKCPSFTTSFWLGQPATWLSQKQQRCQRQQRIGSFFIIAWSTYSVLLFFPQMHYPHNNTIRVIISLLFIAKFSTALVKCSNIIIYSVFLLFSGYFLWIAQISVERQAPEKACLLSKTDRVLFLVWKKENLCKSCISLTNTAGLPPKREWISTDFNSFVFFDRAKL